VGSIWYANGIAHLSTIGLNLHDERILGIIVTDKREKFSLTFTGFKPGCGLLHQKFLTSPDVPETASAPDARFKRRGQVCRGVFMFLYGL